MTEGLNCCLLTNDSKVANSVSLILIDQRAELQATRPVVCLKTVVKLITLSFQFHHFIRFSVSISNTLHIYGVTRKRGFFFAG